VKARKTEKELVGCDMSRSEDNGIDLGSATAFCQQRRMASKCGPMCLCYWMN